MKRLLFFTLMTILSFNATAQSSYFKTRYEETDGKQTFTYTETVDFAKKMAKEFSQLKYESFGYSEEGRELPLLIYDSDGNFTVDEVRKSGKLVLMVQACIHAGETCGNDAGMMLMRDLAVNKFLRLGRNVTILFIPIFNADGYERFGEYNRINQNGPEKTGRRTNARNLDLNRDYMKCDTKEMKAWHKLFNYWMPDFYVDCHSSDGADYQYVLTYEMCTRGTMDKKLTDWQITQFIPFFEKGMEKSNIPIHRYVVFKNWHDPRSGLVQGVARPCTSHAYVALRNRPSLLLETHMLKPYKQRVESVYDAIKYTVRCLDKNERRLRDLIVEADKFSASEEFLKRYYTLQYEVDMTDSVMVDFKGVEYTVEKSDLTGGNWFKYNPDKPVDYKVPLFDYQIMKHRVYFPAAYLVPQAYSDVIERLKIHGIECFRIDGKYNFTSEVTRFKDVKILPYIFEGRHVVQFDYDRYNSEVIVEDGDYIVPIAQKDSRLAAQLLEPFGPDSFVNWGFFGTSFEMKEYGESYVLEKMARQMLKENPGLKKEYESKKKEDESFANNPLMQLKWFYMKSPYRDKCYNIYPVKRIMNKVILNYLPRKE